MDFAGNSSPEVEDPNVYLVIPDASLSPQYENTKTTAASAIGQETFAQKFAATTAGDYSQQYQVTCVLLLFFCSQKL